MLCARVVRGISSTEKEVTLRVRDLLNGNKRPDGAQKSDQDLVAAKERQIGAARLVVRSVTEHLRDDVGRGKHLGPIRDNLCALGGVLGIGKARSDARAGLDDNLHACLGESGNDNGHKRHAPLPRICFSGNTDNHEASSLWSLRRDTHTAPAI